MTDAVRTRPKDRRESILAAAGARFSQGGYAGTSLEDIAGDLGVTAPALYRHFRSKDDLYTAVLEVNLRQLEGCLAEATSADTVIAGLARIAVEYPTVGLLWNTDRRRRLVDPQGVIQQRLVAAADRLGALFEEYAPPQLAALLARAALAAASSTGFYVSPLAQAEQAGQLERAITAVATFAPADALVELAVAAEVAAHRPWATRRSALLDAGALLIAQRGGYHAVTMEEIAALAGVSAPSVYAEFAGKADLFAAVARRAASWLTATLQQASAQATSAEEALGLAVTASLELSAQHPSWTGSLADELPTLPPEQGAEVTRMVDEYLDEWLALCSAAAPALSTEEARVRVRAALAVVDDRALEARERRVLSSDDSVRLMLAMMRS
ncbi:MAG: putative transcriptional regulator, TetR family [Microbacteriaceae bacterium]|nr:putative transcriptional regulator, TetR family [Microbacteriaceae bacterium]